MDELLKEIAPVVVSETARASKQYGDRYASAHEASQPKWTLCKDDLPQCSGDFIVLITNSDGEKLVVASEYDFDDDNYTGRFCDVARNYTVVAWQPLPEMPSHV